MRWKYLLMLSTSRFVELSYTYLYLPKKKKSLIRLNTLILFFKIAVFYTIITLNASIDWDSHRKILQCFTSIFAKCSFEALWLLMYSFYQKLQLYFLIIIIILLWNLRKIFVFSRFGAIFLRNRSPLFFSCFIQTLPSGWVRDKPSGMLGSPPANGLIRRHPNGRQTSGAWDRAAL